jgi:SPP1 gp7 family putative phage head morphogenesis protein
MAKKKSISRKIKHTENKPDNKSKPNYGEITSFLISPQYISDWNIWMTNPNQLIKERGWAFLDEMIRDAVYNTCFRLKNYARLSTGWHIEAWSDDKGDQLVAEYIDFCFREGMGGTFRDKLEMIYSAQNYGFSFSEINWQLFKSNKYRHITSGKWSGKVGIESIKTRYPAYIQFKLDKHGNIEEIGQQGIGQMKAEPIEREKAIIYTHNPEFENPYGTPDPIYIYKHYISKKWLLRFWNISLERRGAGILFIKYPPDQVDLEEDALEIMDTIQSTTGISIPNTCDIGSLNPTPGTSPFEEAIDKQNMMISRGLLMPDSLGFSSVAFGSWAKAKQEFDVFLMVLDKNKAISEESIIGEQLIRRLVDYNFGSDIPAPYFKFNPLTHEDIHQVAISWAALVNAGAVTPTEEDEKYIRENLGMPTEPSKPLILSLNQNKRNFNTLSEKTKKYTEKNVKVKLDPNRFIGRKVINHKELEKEWNELENGFKEELVNVFTKMEEKMYDYLDKQKFYTTALSGAPNASNIVEKIQLPYKGDLKRIIHNWSVNAFLNSKHTAYRELKSAMKEKLPDKLKYQEDLKFSIEFTVGKALEAKDAYAYFKDKIPITKKELDFYYNKAFTITRIESEKILGDAQMILYQHLKDGDTVKTQNNLRALWKRYRMTGELNDQGELNNPSRLNIIVTQNTNEAVNGGRYAMFEDPELQRIIVGYMWDATLDGRTTEYCEEMNGRIFTVDEFTPPPAHFGCRSTFEPIYEWETYQYSKWENSPYKGFSEEVIYALCSRAFL